MKAGNKTSKTGQAEGDKTASQQSQGLAKVQKNYGHTSGMRESRKLHWKTPTFMIGSLIVGVAFATGHHFFYEYCHGKEADHQLQQQWVTRAGTAFAFVVKMSLAISTGIAYVQQCWVSLRSRPESVKRVDAMFSILTNILQFLDPGLWLRSPILTFLAVVTW